MFADFTTFQIEITKNYRQLEWRDDLKTVLKLAGVQLKPVVFLFVDTQITEEIFLENVNNILSSGEVPNLFDDTDLGIIFEKMNPLVMQAQLPVNKTNMYAMFIKMIKRNMWAFPSQPPFGVSSSPPAQLSADSLPQARGHVHVTAGRRVPQPYPAVPVSHQLLHH